MNVQHPGEKNEANMLPRRGAGATPALIANVHPVMSRLTEYCKNVYQRGLFQYADWYITKTVLFHART